MLHYNVRLSHCDPMHPGTQVLYVRRKEVRRRSERVAARTMLKLDRQIVLDMYRRRNEQLVEGKTSYFTKKVEESKDNPKALFRLTRNMMGNRGETVLPLHTCKRNLANDFSAFFYNKILTIRSELGLPGLYKCGSMTTSFFKLMICII